MRSDPFHSIRKVSLRRVSPGPLLGFVVHFCDDSIFLVHEVVMNFFQLPDAAKTFPIESFYTNLVSLHGKKRKKEESPEEDNVGSDAEQHGNGAVTDQMQVPSPPLLSLLC